MGSKRLKLKADQYKKLARELNRTKTREELADEFGCSVFSIDSIKRKMMAAGVKFPDAENSLALAINDLKKSDPELFKPFSKKGE